MFVVPAGLAHLREHSRGAEWLSVLEPTVAAAVDRWGLTVGAPFDGCHVSWTAPAELPGGHPVVVKVPFPHEESRHEAEALRRWDGIGAIRLLDADEATGDLLLERAQPGRPLSSLPMDEALDVVVALLQVLTVPASRPFSEVTADGERWAATLTDRWERAGRPYPQWVLRQTLELLDGELPRARREPKMLLHQDLHGDNIVESARGWLAIDPKPVVGPIDFAVAPVVRSFEFGHSHAAVTRRFDRLVDELELDATAALTWTAAQTLAWSTEPSEFAALHRESVVWLLERELG